MSLELNEQLQAVTDALSDKFSDKLIEVYQSSGDTFFRVEANSILEISKFLKEELHYIYLTDIIGTDRYTSQERFEVIYVLMNLRVQQRIFVKVRIEEENPVLDSVHSVWLSANWHEREAFDMYGIRFNDHPDLRRIYLPEDFEYYPLRKEFPLLGIPGSIDLPHTTPDSD